MVQLASSNRAPIPSTTPMDRILDEWQADPDRRERIVHVERELERGAIHERLDPPLPEPIAAALAERGIDQLYRHQARAIRSAREGRDLVIVAGTASGKSLCYQVPIAEAVMAEPKGAAALALYPTKALTQDQRSGFERLGVEELVAAVYDGDTDRDQRLWARRHANVVLTNPDMLHVGILPNHTRWADFLHRLRYVVVDELHVLRGIFGSHVAHVLRRLRRLCAHYQADPAFVFTSATIGNPGELAAALVGRPVEVIDQDTSPAGERIWVLWNPPLEEEEEGIRKSSLGESTDAFVDLVRHEVPTIVFSRSRKATELMYRWARDRLDGDHADRIAPYRGGYLPRQRRKIERALFSGDLLGVTATNALELGIDVGGLDAAVVNTFPGTIASLRQQTGRAGRTSKQSLAVLVAGQDALDQYYMTHPDELFTRPPEAAVVNPGNPRLVAAHMGAAAYELPLVPEDRRWLGDAIEELAPDLVADGALRVRAGKLFWARRRAPAPDINIRSSDGRVYTIVDRRGDVVGSMEESRAFSQAHEGAVYLHQGDTYLVDELDRRQREIRVHKARTAYYTQPKEDKHLEVREGRARGTVGRFGIGLGTVEVETHVVGYRRKSIKGGEVLGYEDLDLPPLRLVTEAFWVTVPEALYGDAGVGWEEVPGTLHAAEHTGIAMLPLFAICDRWDVGGLSTALHPQVGGGVWFIYDGYAGGAGIAPIGFEAAERHLRATLEAIRRCPCAAGCPSCVQSPKCGNFNDPLSKAGAERLLAAGLGAGW